jgi:hypothetical protein
MAVFQHAGVAELADALDSKSSDRKIVWVRAPPPAFALALDAWLPARESFRSWVFSVRCLEVNFPSGRGIGQEKLFDRFARDNNQREYTKDRAERHKKAFDAGDDEHEPIARAFGERAAGDQNAKGHGEPEQKEKGAKSNENPTQKFRRRFSGLLRIGVLRSPDEKRAHASVEQRETRKKCRQTGDDVMKDRQ